MTGTPTNAVSPILVNFLFLVGAFFYETLRSSVRKSSPPTYVPIPFHQYVSTNLIATDGHVWPDCLVQDFTTKCILFQVDFSNTIHPYWLIKTFCQNSIDHFHRWYCLYMQNKRFISYFGPSFDTILFLFLLKKLIPCPLPAIPEVFGVVVAFQAINCCCIGVSVIKLVIKLVIKHKALLGVRGIISFKPFG